MRLRGSPHTSRSLAFLPDSSSLGCELLLTFGYDAFEVHGLSGSTDLTWGSMAHDHYDMLNQFRQSSLDRFTQRQRIRSFAGFMEDFLENPYPYLRNSPRYLCDMFEFYGTENVELVGKTDRRWKFFNLEFARSEDSLVAQEPVQNAIYMKLRQFAQNGKADRLILLHGPNGSSKSTTIQAIMHGMTDYSIYPEGALYRFNWMFPEKSIEGGRIGFDDEDSDKSGSFAFLKAKDIRSIIRCELKDSPLLLIPKVERKELIQKALELHPEIAQKSHFNYDWAIYGDLSQKSKWIYEALLATHQGDWLEVMRHIQVERFFHSRRYRLGCLSIEPQGNIDAQAKPVGVAGKSFPGILQGMPLYELEGELVDANRGLCEYSDFLKRPPETNKYLLTTSEKGTIQLPNYRAHLDLVLTGTANEKQLNLFKKTPDFSSFKGRLALVRVPYLLEYSREAELYQRHILRHASGESVAPHTAEMTALWAVLTRLRRPSPSKHSPELAPIVARITPLQKALLYDHGEVSFDLKEEERKLLYQNIMALRLEHDDAEAEFEGIYGAEYEGRRGISPRDMMTLIATAAENQSWNSISPLSVFAELQLFIKESSVHEFLRISSDNGYHDYSQFIDDVRQHYLGIVRQEVYESIGIVEEGEFDRVFIDYFQHVKVFNSGQKYYSNQTGQYQEPSQMLMGRVEELLKINQSIPSFRSDLMSRIGAYATENPDQPLDYQDVFPEIYRKLKHSFWRERESALDDVQNTVLQYFTDERSKLTGGEIQEVENTLSKMVTRFSYDLKSARDVITFVASSR